VLVTTGPRRVTAMPDVPAIGESGIVDAEVLGWYGLVGPRSIPKDIVARVNMEIAKAMKLPDIQEKFAQQSLDPDVNPPEHFAQLIQDEYARWTKVIRAAGIKLEQ
jgi:tripartite-type tricarboxylate transporter receptor subunit TctC